MSKARNIYDRRLYDMQFEQCHSLESRSRAIYLSSFRQSPRNAFLLQVKESTYLKISSVSDFQ